jgi:hypothetical protein
MGCWLNKPINPWAVGGISPLTHGLLADSMHKAHPSTHLCKEKPKLLKSLSLSLSMATSLLSPLSAPPSSTVEESRVFGQVGTSLGLQRSPFLHGTKLFSASFAHPRNSTARRCFRSPLAKSLDHIPKQFREENIKDGC